MDSENRLATLYDYKVVPNGIFLDENLVIRYRKTGGFDVDKAPDVEAIRKLVEGAEQQIESDGKEPAYQLSRIEQELVETQMRLGRELLRRGAKEEAIAEWQAALRRDPGNFTIRKQIWMARHPERFNPTIDFDWQKEQLARERAAEIEAGICGPDGCPLPGSTPRQVS